jgi:type IV secretion system protein VirD4
MSGDQQRLAGLLVAGVGAALVGLVWVTGALAGLIFSGSPVATPAGAAIEVALRLPTHLGDPRLAWRPAARHGLPGPVGVYLVLVLELAALGLTARVMAPRLHGIELTALAGGRDKPPVAYWARRRDLTPLIVDGPKRGRVTLGRRGRDLLAAEEGQSVIIFGPTQSGKTSGLVIPAILEWEGPLVAVSVKSDLLAPTLQRREELGETWVFDPTQSVDVERARATPLRSADNWEGALRTAHRIASSAKVSAGDLSDGNFWFANGEKLLAPLLLAANRAGGTMETVVGWVDEGPEACEGTVLPILEGASEEQASRAFLATQNREERARSSVYTTTETMIAAWADPRVAEETAGSDYTPERLLDGGANTLFLISPRSEQERLRVVLSTLIEELIGEAEEMTIRNGRPIAPRLLLALDEFANAAPFPRADEVAATGSGIGIQMLTVLQDLSQLKARLGNRAMSTVNNHPAKIAVGGIADHDTTEYFSRLAGTGRFAHRSTSTGRGRGGDSTTEGETYRELAPQHLLREMDAGVALLAHGNRAATRITLRPWFRGALNDGCVSGSAIR